MPQKTFAEIGQPGARYHLFLCVGPDCCSTTEGMATWTHIKDAVREHDLPVMRTKADCFRLCSDGPWLVIYPDGVWYSHVTPERFDRIRQEHIQGGKPVQEWVRAVNAVRPRAGVEYPG